MYAIRSYYANSAYFSLGSRVHDVFQAVRLLGLETVRALVLQVGIFRQFDKSPEHAAVLRDLDSYGLSVATLARRIAREEGLSENLRDQAFCAGMLACIGTLVFFDAEPLKTREILRRAEEGEDLAALEREVFGASQAELGGYLLGLWGFNNAVVEAVRYQNKPSACVYADRSSLTCVHLARAFGPRWPFGSRTLRPVMLDIDYVRHLGMEAVITSYSIHYTKLYEAVSNPCRASAVWAFEMPRLAYPAPAIWNCAVWASSESRAFRRTAWKAPSILWNADHDVPAMIAMRVMMIAALPYSLTGIRRFLRFVMTSPT